MSQVRISSSAAQAGKPTECTWIGRLTLRGTLLLVREARRGSHSPPATRVWTGCATAAHVADQVAVTDAAKKVQFHPSAAVALFSATFSSTSETVPA